MGLARFTDLLAQVSYAGLSVECGFDGWQSPPSESPNYFLRWTDPSATCNTTGEALHSKGRKWRLSQHMVDGEVVGTAFKALLTYLEHEAREQFTFQGVSVYDSHVDIHKLVALRKEPDSIVGRAPPRDELPRCADLEDCHFDSRDHKFYHALACPLYHVFKGGASQ